MSLTQIMHLRGRMLVLMSREKGMSHIRGFVLNVTKSDSLQPSCLRFNGRQMEELTEGELGENRGFNGQRTSL